MTIRGKLVAEARALIGTPYGLHGRVPGVMLDCAGIMVVALARCGVVIKSTWNYPNQPSHDVAQHWLQGFCKRIEIEQAIRGDVLHIDYRGFAHLGILTELDTIVTVRPGAGGEVYESPVDFRKRVVSAWTLPGVDDG